MSGKIFKNDPYMLKRLQDKDVKCFIDIGANKGTTSIMARVLYPYAKIIAFEPHGETFDVLCTQAMPWGIRCFREAIGGGEELWFKPGGFSGTNRFVDKNTFDISRDKHNARERTYPIKSISLSDLFRKYKIPYGSDSGNVIKMDCEGGEKCLLEDKDSIEIIKNSLMISMELHFAYVGGFEIWNEWFKIFTATHQLYAWKMVDGESTFIQFDQLPTKKFSQVALLNRSMEEL